MAMLHQAGILQFIPKTARYMVFTVRDEDMLKTCLRDLADICDGDALVIGLGQSLVSALHEDIPGLRPFPALANQGIDIPSTPGAIWCWLRGDDAGELYLRGREIEELLTPGFQLEEIIDAFQYKDSRDLSGYEDGTENPKGDEAVAAAFQHDRGAGLDGGSFVAVQQWLHDMDFIQSLEADEKDNMIGRHLADNEEFDEAPESAHVKRTAQESFTPPAFILRRSMPWVSDSDAGLVFVAFTNNLDRYEVILRRMLGLEDNIRDALFDYSRPLSGAYYWCPPMKNGKPDLSRLGV